MSKNVQYLHYRLRSSYNYYYQTNKGNSKNGVITVKVDKLDGEHARVSFAICSPKDHFVKKIGRDLSDQKMIAGDYYNVYMPQKVDKYMILLKIFEETFLDPDNENFPNWFKKNISKNHESIIGEFCLYKPCRFTHRTQTVFVRR